MVSIKGEGVKSSWKWAIGLAVAIVIGLSATYFFKTQSQKSVGLLGKIQDFTLPTFSSEKVALSSFKGKPIVLHFWASWCPPCVEEIQNFQLAAQKSQKLELQWVAVSGDKTWLDAEKLLPSKDLPPNIVSLLDLGGKVSETMGSFEFPETYLLTPDLRIVAKWVGPRNWDSPEILLALEKLVELSKKLSRPTQ